MNSHPAARFSFEDPFRKKGVNCGEILLIDPVLPHRH